MAKLYKVKMKPKNLIILHGNAYFADNEYELTMTHNEALAYKSYMEIIGQPLVIEQPEKNETTETRKGRPPKKEGN